MISGAHDAGCEAVAVYAADDATSPHVAEADAAVLLPGASLAETYLDPDALVRAAKVSGADALHPGYGFLSENPALPEACAPAGITWVGPPPEAMRVMGHKATGKRGRGRGGRPGAAERAARWRRRRVGSWPPRRPAWAIRCSSRRRPEGADGACASCARRTSWTTRWPRRGARPPVRSVPTRSSWSATSKHRAMSRSRSSATPRVRCSISSTGSARCSAGTRRSSRRRRRSWCPTSTRREMWEAAVAAARAVGYVGVGTVEYLVDESGFYFLEMNTRLQVEHGVTELVTGLDLVGLQLLVAGGSPLPFGQSDVTVRGHAVEVRLCAERPREGYRPTPGPVSRVRWPAGEGLRTDRGVESGSVVSPTYDSLVAKLMAHGSDRRRAVARLSRALRALELDGLETNRDLLQAVLDDDVFRRGDADIHYLDGRPDLRDARLGDEVRQRHAAAAAFCLLAAPRRPKPGPGAVRPAGATSDTRCMPTSSLTAPAPWRSAPHLVRSAGADPGRRRLARRGNGPTPDPAARVARASGRNRRTRRWRPPGWSISPQKTGCAGATGSASRRTAPRSTAPKDNRASCLRAEDDPDERGGVAGECRAPLPGVIGKVLVATGRPCCRGRRPGRARGHEDGAHPSGERCGHRDGRALRARSTGGRQ